MFHVIDYRESEDMHKIAVSEARARPMLMTILDAVDEGYIVGEFRLRRFGAATVWIIHAEKHDAGAHTLSLHLRTALAKLAGAALYHADAERSAPVLDPIWSRLTAGLGLGEGGADISKAWIAGWTTELLNAPLPNTE